MQNITKPELNTLMLALDFFMAKDFDEPVKSRLELLHSKLEEHYKSFQHSVRRTVDQPCEKHNMEFCSECFPVVVVDFTRR